MSAPRIALIPLLATLATSQAELLVYEPFDYRPHNHEIHGRLEGRNGGEGFADTTPQTIQRVWGSGTSADRIFVDIEVSQN